MPTPYESDFVKRIDVEFRWHPGMAPSQKAKNILSLHNAAALEGYRPLLEISSYSENELGRRLSAFSLKTKSPIGPIPLESAYQGSKVFASGVKYEDIYRFDARSAKKDPRIRGSGEIIGFDFFGIRWDAEPKTAFFDWLYANSLFEHSDFLKRHLSDFVGFTDISFNPNRSINNQARACALLVSLLKNGQLESAICSGEQFLRIVYRVDKRKIIQPSSDLLSTLN